MIFRQLIDYETNTYTYILADEQTKEAVVIDPVIEHAERDAQLINELGLTVKYFLDTHVHADHITGSSRMKNILKTGEIGVGAQNTGVTHNDLFLDDNEVLTFGNKKIKVLETPGHTHGCVSYLVENMVFTGDLLLIRGSGRTDFQSGSNEEMFHNIRKKIFSLPDDTIIYPAHDYKGFTSSSIGEEKGYNPRLKLENSFEDFTGIMDNLNLPNPKKIDVSLPANLKSGYVEELF